MPNKGRRVSMRIVHRHHFSSALKRMSAIVSLQNPGSSSSEYMVTVKGAPETLRSMVSVRSTVSQELSYLAINRCSRLDY